MTTVAFKDGVVAADSRCSRGQYICHGDATKLFRVDDWAGGGVCVVVGTPSAASELIGWLTSGPGALTMPTVESGASVIWFQPDGRVFVHEEGGNQEAKCDMGAWGSGMPVALGAMHAGASAVEAVEIAARVDPWTGGPVVSMKVAP